MDYKNMDLKFGQNTYKKADNKQNLNKDLKKREGRKPAMFYGPAHNQTL